MAKHRLTVADWQTIRRALNDAMEDRASFADAYGNVGPEAEKALDQVRRYERLHEKLFGRASQRRKDIARFAAMPSAPITELLARYRTPLPPEQRPDGHPHDEPDHASAEQPPDH